MGLTNKIVMITGVPSGIGKMTAKEFLKRGDESRASAV
jgi:NAD(P)-dependent dehydrogenase (short-subunit alcohol dehydrogenase family)